MNPKSGAIAMRTLYALGSMFYAFGLLLGERRRLDSQLALFAFLLGAPFLLL